MLRIKYCTTKFLLSGGWFHVFYVMMRTLSQINTATDFTPKITDNITNRVLSVAFMQLLSNRVCHAKTGLQIFVLVLPKEGLAGVSPTQPFFGMTQTIELCSDVSTGLFHKHIANGITSLTLTSKHLTIRQTFSPTKLGAINCQRKGVQVDSKCSKNVVRYM